MYRVNALSSAALFFVFWVVVLYAGADHPPPRGFLLVILLALGCAVVVYLRVPAYVDWNLERRSHRYLYVLLDGWVAGLILAFLTSLAPGTGEPSVTTNLIGRVYWFAVVGAVGALNAVAIYAGNALYLNVLARAGGRR